MSTSLFKFILRYIYLIPINILNFFLLNDPTWTKTKDIFGSTKYTLNYTGSDLSIFSLPLLISLSQISNELLKLTKGKKVISIVSIAIFHELNTGEELTHNLEDGSELYTSDNLNKWAISIFFNLIEKLELYASFKKISIIIRVTTITHIN